MTMKRVVMAVVCLFGLAVANSASAAVINGQFVPDSLVGSFQKYRLIFVTAGGTAATDPTKAFYDNFVQAEANRPGSVFQGMNHLYKWEAVVTVGQGTVTNTAASVLTGNSLGGLGIYNLAGASLGTGNDIVNNGDVNAAVGYHQFMSFAGDSAVWTGSNKYGQGATNNQALWLGTPYNGAIGLSSSDASGWLAVESGPGAAAFLAKTFGGYGGVPLSKIGLPVYGISGELTAVPEPSTIALWSVCAGAVGLVAWRKRRKRN